MPDLLIELFSEEIPARMQSRAREDLKKRVTDGLVEAGLTYGSAQAFSTPRRLVLGVEGLSENSPTTREERKGPRVDAPEKALQGFLRATGLSREQLGVRDEKKGQVYFAEIVKEGRPAAEIVGEVLEDTIRNFPWPKSMRWGAGSLRWVRPLHAILCILSREDGAEVVPVVVEGIHAGDTTRGHRFMAPDAFRVTSFEDYAAKLKRAFVVIDPAERADQIWHDATNAAFAQGLEVVEDKGLLAEVAGLVEWPVVLMGAIGEEFLDLPPEVLQTSMKEHQKFFSVRDPKTGRIVKFVTVANRETADHGATILAGNQKVLSARLSDAKFFWENDLRVAKSGMTLWLQKLDNVTFHNKLGTQAQRIERIVKLSRAIAPLVGADPAAAAEAAEGAVVWVHDYNLWLMPGYLRTLRPDVKISFFHHTPFPNADIFNVLPWRKEILESLLSCDVVGFHIPRYANNFVSAARSLLEVETLKREKVKPELSSETSALSEQSVVTEIGYDGRRIRLQASPVGVDVGYIEQVASRAQTAQRVREIKEELGDCRLILSVGRTDYTKGGIEQLESFERLMESRPDLRGKVRLMHVSVAANSNMTAYEEIQRDLEHLAGKINGRYGRFDWQPVARISRPIEFTDLVAYYRAADVAWITPLADGMNLVCKEFCAARTDGDGVLVLSEFAGAAVELAAAVPTNPFSYKSMDGAIQFALEMPKEERVGRMKTNREMVQKQDIRFWAADQMQAFGNDVLPQRRSEPAA